MVMNKRRGSERKVAKPLLASLLPFVEEADVRETGALLSTSRKK
jgi:hypothetical protein